MRCFSCCTPKSEVSDLPYANTASRSPSNPHRHCLGLFDTPIVSFGLIICASLLVIAWLIVVAFITDFDTLHHKYTFEPRSVTSFTVWGTAAIAIPSTMIPFAGYALVVGEKRTRRWILYAMGAFFTAMLVSGNLLSTSETSKRENFELQFAVKFNDFYCDTRTLKVCLEGSRADVLLLTRGNSTTANASSDDAALSIWSRCREVMLEGMAQEAKRDEAEGDSEEGEKEIETKPLYKFLKDYQASHEVDLWCGNALQRKTPLSDQEQRTFPAPHAANPKMFEKYTREWSKRMLYSNVLLGSALGCMLLAVLSLKSEGRDF